MEELPSENIQQIIFEAMSLTDDGMGIFDANDIMTFCNDSLAALFGMSAKKALNKSFEMLVENSFEEANFRFGQ